MTIVSETILRGFIAEDLGDGDLTAAIIPVTKQACAEIVTREDMVLCGQAWFEGVFKLLDGNATFVWAQSEGTRLVAGASVCRVTGQARALLSGERTALNLLQTLSATATIARRYADAIAGTGCKVLDTRKTIPGLRAAQKYAVKCGGCDNHRMGLYDAVLIKENHILAAGSITNAIATARQQAPVMVEVEVESLVQLKEALAAQPDRILLDNFALADLREAVALTAGRVALEVSGNIRLDNIREVAKTGVNFISIGALTKDVKAIDLSMRIEFVQ